MRIRPEISKDSDGVYAVNLAAFGRPGEAELVNALKGTVEPLVSLVAEEGGNILGHVLFTPVRVTGHPDTKIMALGPIAVRPEHQRQGIGTRLIRAGLEKCKGLRCGAVVVLGHPTYYPQFGFVAASRFGLRCEYDVPDEVFMAVELYPGYLNGVTGTVLYHESFRGL